jgi:uncharacterized protein (TIGR00730 family)
MQKLKSICINCGSSPGLLPDYLEDAKQLGKYFALNNVQIVYGGSNVGLMGAIADSALENNGVVIGVIPDKIADKVGHKNLTKIYTVKTMHERKNLMFELSDGFIALPGGFGTFEEILELLTWAQLGFHTKPCGLLNISGYYDMFLKFIEHSVQQRFIKPEHQKMMLVSNNISELHKLMLNYESVVSDKWIDKKD